MNRGIILLFLMMLFIVFVCMFISFSQKPKIDEDDIIIIEDCMYGKFKCFKHDQTICKNIKENKVWEKQILDLLLKHYHPDTNMIDIGCNYGCHTIGVANEIKRQNGTGKVYAFDIQPKILRLFQENVNENGLSSFVVSYPFGLSNKNETKTFNLPKNYNVDSNPGALSLLRKKESNDYENINVELKRLDDLYLSNISVIKIDVEGFELEALEGARQTILSNRPTILIEIWENNKKQYFDWIQTNFPFYDIQHVSADDYILLSK